MFTAPQRQRLPEESPRFQGLIERFFDDSAIQDLRRAYEFAISSGGMEEIDILRDPEVSFNPRPARVAELLIIDAKVREKDTVTAAVLATASDTNSADFSDGTLKLSLESKSENLEQMSYPAQQIALAAWLDRVRHFHMADEKKLNELSPDIIERTKKYIEISSAEHKVLSAKLRTWLSMFERRK